MALRAFDGFDDRPNTDYVWVRYPYAVGAWNLIAGRFGGKAIQQNGTTRTYIKFFTGTTTQTWITGIAFKATNSGARYPIFSFSDNSNGAEQISVWSDWDRKIYFGMWGTQTGTVICGTEWAINFDVWHYIEVKVTISPSCPANSCQIWVDGVLYSTLPAGTNTRRGTTNNYAGEVVLGNYAGYNVYAAAYDDWYICDDTGSSYNAPLGDCQVSILLPDGAGSAAEWTPTPAGAGLNYQRVQTNDVETSYVASATVNARDSYSVANLAVNPAKIHAVQAVAVARPDASETTRKLGFALRSGGNYYPAANPPIVKNVGYYLSYPAFWTTDPATGLPWTRDSLNAIEAGITLVS